MIAISGCNYRYRVECEEFEKTQVGFILGIIQENLCGLLEDVLTYGEDDVFYPHAQTGSAFNAVLMWFLGPI